MDPLDFLAAHAPFDSLSAAGRQRLDKVLEITWARAGSRIVERGGAQPYLYALRKGHVRLELDGRQVAHVGSGQLFGLTSLLDESRFDAFDVVADSDCLLYRLPAGVVRGLCDSEPGFAHFFLERLAGRLRSLADSQSVALTSDLAVQVGDLVRRRPVTLDLDSAPTLRDVARCLQADRVSSVLLLGTGDTRPVGIVTDRDLRRALAESLGPDTPAAQVMTSPVECLDVATPGAEALLHLLHSGRHHLVLERIADGGSELVGVVSHSDLLRRHLQSPGALLETIRRAGQPEQLADYADRVAACVETLRRSGVEATDVGRVVAALNDALCSRLLELAEAALGEPPCHYAFLVFGSEGRQEQSFLTDQDNALVYDDPAAADYFQGLAERVVDGLLIAGFPPCAGGFMATRWCSPLAEWRQRFQSWIGEPDPENLLRVAIFFDWRAVYGGLDLEPLEAVVRDAAADRRFLAQLARASMSKRPPLGLLHRITSEEGGVDLKSGALMPVSGLARLFALEAGERSGSTVRRLHRAARAGTVSEDGAELLTEAFRFVFGLRLRRQLADRAAGRPLSNRVALDELSAGERRHLKEAFLAIERMQTATEQRLETAMLG